MLRSFRAKLQASFFVLGLSAIAVTYWQASAGATAALRQTTYEHLTAVRETKKRLIEHYFADLTNRVIALSTDESSITALEQFRSAWATIPGIAPGDPQYAGLRALYKETPEWFPDGARTRGLQALFLLGAGPGDLVLQPGGSGAYGEVHARYHPTFHRYKSAFELYDIFLIDASGRVLYTVSKEIDLGAALRAAPYSASTLAKAFEHAMAVDVPDKAVVEDYARYAPSEFAPAAFVAAPVWRAGAKIGVLAIQVSIDGVNRMITGDRNWQGEGMGRTGQTYLVGSDGTLRSDLRPEIERPDEFFTRLQEAGEPANALERARRDKTAILNLSVPAEVARSIGSGDSGARIGKDFLGTDVIRSHAKLDLPGLDWIVIAEMAAGEAFEPVAALQRRLLIAGILVAAGFLAAAWFLGGSVTRPVKALLQGTQRLSGRDFGVRLPVESRDEIGQLAQSFNSMAERLEQTTVSRDELDRANHELAALNSRLISAQEDERRRLARELHDDLSQRLAAVAISAGALKNLSGSDPSPMRAGLESVQRQLAGISDDVHGLSRRLHPATLDDLGLLAAIESECRGFFDRGGPPVDFSHSGSFENMSKDAQLATYRIVQEALRNILRHAGAQDVSLRLDAMPEGVQLTVEDNGRGFDQRSPDWRAGVGLASMSERARLAGGALSIRSVPGEGTVISARIPWEAS